MAKVNQALAKLNDTQLAELNQRVASVCELNNWTSLDPRDERSLVLLPEIRFGAPKEIADLSDQVIEVEHVFWHHVSMEDEQSGEIKNLRRITLISPKDELYVGCGVGIRQSLEMYFPFLGLPPWSPAVKFRIRLIKLGEGKKMPTLIREVAK
jgi:hypothetical protein